MSNKPLLTPAQWLKTHPDVQVESKGFLGPEHVVPINENPIERLDSTLSELNNAKPLE